MGCCMYSKLGRKFTKKTELLSPLLDNLAPQLTTETKVILVRVHGVSELQPLPSLVSGLADPYVTLQMTPEDPIAGPQPQQSSYLTNTLSPKWTPPETFQFIVSNINASKIIVSVYSFRPIKEPLPMGDIPITLKELLSSSEKKGIRKQYRLINPNNGKKEGLLDLEFDILSVKEATSIQEHSVYEYQRWKPIGEWGNSSNHLLPTDPGGFSSGDEKRFGRTMEEVAPKVPEGWIVEKEWHALANDQDPEGWQYATDFTSTYWASSVKRQYVVRRRMWRRVVSTPVKDNSSSSKKAGSRGRRITEND